MRHLIRFIRIYTPFICTIMALLNGVLFMKGATEISLINLLAAISGNSIIVVLYIISRLGGNCGCGNGCGCGCGQ